MATKKERQLVAVAQGHGADAPKFTEADAMAMKALAAGVANEGQQKMALDWIFNSACGLRVWPYKESERETCIALGRQFVAHQIVSLIQINNSSFGSREHAAG